MITAARRRRIKFFADNAGYATPPGRLLCAKSLADAEEAREAAEAEGRLAIRWEADEDVDLSWADEEVLAKINDGTYEVLACLVTLEADGEAKSAGLCGIIVGANDTYARVVEAELVSELLAEMGA